LFEHGGTRKKEKKVFQRRDTAVLRSGAQYKDHGPENLDAKKEKRVRRKTIPVVPPGLSGGREERPILPEGEGGY